jgi:hypothetical protein
MTYSLLTIPKTEKPATLTRREAYMRKPRTVSASTAHKLATLHVFSRVPISQIAFYFNVGEDRVVKWVRAAYRQRPLKWNKWRGELDLYELCGLHPERP